MNPSNLDENLSPRSFGFLRLQNKPFSLRGYYGPELDSRTWSWKNQVRVKM